MCYTRKLNLARINYYKLQKINFRKSKTVKKLGQKKQKGKIVVFGFSPISDYLDQAGHILLLRAGGGNFFKFKLERLLQILSRTEKKLRGICVCGSA